MARLFNGGSQPLVPAGLWTDGVVMPGEYIDVDNPEAYGPPWVVDREAEKALADLEAPEGEPKAEADVVGPVVTPKQER